MVLQLQPNGGEPLRARSFVLALVAALCAVSVVLVVSRDHNSSSKPHSKVVLVLPSNNKPESETPVDPRLIKALNQFTFELFAEIVKGEEGNNVFVCPPSMAMSLSMVYNGAKGETKKAMADALQVQGLSVNDLNKAYSDLLENLNAPGPGVQIQIANGVWGDNSCVFKRDFMNVCKNSYGADIYKADLASRATVDHVNQWVSDKTKGRIDSIVDRFGPQTIMSLINAVYFDAAWAYPFEKSKTKPGKFILVNGEQVNVPMMSAFRGTSYLMGEGFKAMDLPYKGDRYSMYVFAPDSPSGLPDFISRLNQQSWTKWLSSFDNGNATVSLPRFNLDCEMKDNMKSALSSLGMSAAFEPARADFTGISGQKSWIGEVVQKTGLTVNENGTIAAAASEVEMWACDGSVEITARHPFLCAVVDDKTDLILFMGAVYNPTKS